MHMVMENACLGNIESKRHHPADRQRLIRHDLATPHAQVVYDSKAFPSPAKRTENSLMYRSFWRLFIDLHTRKLTRIGAQALTNSLPG